MNFATGRPTWTWPDWRKAPSGLRVRHNQTGRLATYVKPSTNRHNGAIVRWDNTPEGTRGKDGKGGSYVISPARDLTPVRVKAWDLIGFPDHYTAEPDSDHLDGRVRLIGGRSLYEAVSHNDETARTNSVRLSRLEATADGLRQINRYIDPDALLEIIADRKEEN